MTANVSLACSSGFYVLIALWWHMQISKKYWKSKQTQTDFSSSVTFHCCSRCRGVPLEGVFKLLSSALVTFVSIYQYQNTTDALEQRQAISQLTVFTLFALSAICDIVFMCCQRFTIQGLDYLMLVICFNVQSVVLAYHTDPTYSWLSVADTCAMYASTFVAISVLMEYKFHHYVWFSVMRAFMTLVLGTWCFHIFIVQCTFNGASPVEIEGLTYNKTTENVKIESLTDDREPAYLENLSLVPIYFSWHFLFNLNLMTIMWLVIMKMASRKCCVCMPDEEEEVTHFENRVHFDYHMVTRMTDSDYEAD